MWRAWRWPRRFGSPASPTSSTTALLHHAPPVTHLRLADELVGSIAQHGGCQRLTPLRLRLFCLRWKHRGSIAAQHLLPVIDLFLSEWDMRDGGMHETKAVTGRAPTTKRNHIERSMRFHQHNRTMIDTEPQHSSKPRNRAAREWKWHRPSGGGQGMPLVSKTTHRGTRTSGTLLRSAILPTPALS